MWLLVSWAHCCSTVKSGLADSDHLHDWLRKLTLLVPEVRSGGIMRHWPRSGNEPLSSIVFILLFFPLPKNMASVLFQCNICGCFHPKILSLGRIQLSRDLLILFWCHWNTNYSVTQSIRVTLVTTSNRGMCRVNVSGFCYQSHTDQLAHRIVSISVASK